MKKIFKKIPVNFDITTYLRYQPIVKVIDNLTGKSQLKIAEVGSGSLGIGPYLKKNFIGFDVAFSNSKSSFLKPIVASANKIPKRFTNQFDLVLSVDMMEHLPPSDRNLALKNMVSLTKKYLLISFPSGRQSFLVDRILNWYYQKTHQKKFNFLTEHLKFSLPKTEEVVVELTKIAQKQNKKIIKKKIVNNTSGFLHLGLLLFGFSQNKYLTRLFFLTFFLRNFLAKINFFPYRKLIVLKFTQ